MELFITFGSYLLLAICLLGVFAMIIRIFTMLFKK